MSFDREQTKKKSIKKIKSGKLIAKKKLNKLFHLLRVVVKHKNLELGL